MTATFDSTGPFDTDEESTISKRVVDSVADATDTDPLELEPLYDSVDPDCLNAIFKNRDTIGQSGGHIQFSMAGCQVVVDADGTVSVTSRSEDTAAASLESTTKATTDVPEPSG